jgi:hypothetical protein
MKINFKRVSALAISFLLVLSSIAFAAPVSNNPAQKEVTKKVIPYDKQKSCHKHRHKKIMTAILRDKFGITEAEFEDAKKSGKSIFELTKSKGFTEQQVKSGLLEEKFKHLDEAVSNGKIDKAKADSIKSQMKIKMEKWDGKIITNNSSPAPKQNIGN